ncbi:hypothetical protein D5F01_LYC15093 [Larimichthys crocea]|uniref:USP domain-containing protein n=1 Tax=Larimichthys crocea TaxID=215358 RepID=A0A6G0I6L9_LARCR|nr:hypothetical protein D5F01_LYC15093 [Larimichthys crocea]
MQPVVSHLQESELEYKCECGGNTSGQGCIRDPAKCDHLAPKTLYLLAPYELMKSHDPVELPRDLVVSSNQNSVADVSILSSQKRSAAATPAPVSAKSSKGGKPNKRLWKNILFGHCLKEHTNPKEERFPNINQSCYMNSILQSLFAMDAHEFLTSVLDQMRSLSSLLQVNAANMNRRYICPVKRHLVFEIEKTRTCNKCGDQSKRKEEFTNLSLDLIPYGSVKEMLQEYVKESELEYKCECGGNTSGQSMAFETLPNVLILHIKRFIYSPTYELMKLHDPVKLHRDLVVSSNQGDGCYSLISIVSHFGSNGKAGHYICDGVHPDDSLSQTTDHWLTFNDSLVRNTTGASVCEKRRESSYILFYKRHVSEHQPELLHELHPAESVCHGGFDHGHHVPEAGLELLEAKLIRMLMLTSVLDQMRSLSSLLQVNAANMNRRYICPVKRHLVFEIEKTRTCNK